MKYSVLLLVLPLIFLNSCGDDVTAIESPPEIVKIETFKEPEIKIYRKITFSDEVVLKKYTKEVKATNGTHPCKLEYTSRPADRVIPRGEALDITGEFFHLSESNETLEYRARFRSDPLMVNKLICVFPKELAENGDFEEFFTETINTSKF